MELDEVWRDYRGKLRGFVQARVSDPADVDDLLQEILIRTHGGMGSLKSGDSLQAWLFQVASNAVTDHYRRRGRARGVQAEDLWYEQDEDGVREELAGCIEPFIDSLPADTAALLRAIELEGQSQKEYAALQGIAYSTLKSRVQKGRAQLRAQFGRCCSFTLDASGNLADYEPKPGACPPC